MAFLDFWISRKYLVENTIVYKIFFFLYFRLYEFLFLPVNWTVRLRGNGARKRRQESKIYTDTALTNRLYYTENNIKGYYLYLLFLGNYFY